MVRRIGQRPAHLQDAVLGQDAVAAEFQFPGHGDVLIGGFGSTAGSFALARGAILLRLRGPVAIGLELLGSGIVGLLHRFLGQDQSGTGHDLPEPGPHEQQGGSGHDRCHSEDLRMMRNLGGAPVGGRGLVLHVSHGYRLSPAARRNPHLVGVSPTTAQ